MVCVRVLVTKPLALRLAFDMSVNLKNQDKSRSSSRLLTLLHLCEIEGKMNRFVKIYYRIRTKEANTEFDPTTMYQRQTLQLIKKHLPLALSTRCLKSIVFLALTCLPPHTPLTSRQYCIDRSTETMYRDSHTNAINQTLSPSVVMSLTEHSLYNQAWSESNRFYYSYMGSYMASYIYI